VIISLIARLWGWSDISSVDDIFHLPLTLTRISRSHVGSVRLLSRISGGESMTAPPTKSFRNCSCHITATNWIGVPHVLAVWKGIDPGFLVWFEFHRSTRIGRAPYQQVDPTLQVLPRRKFLEPLRQADHHVRLRTNQRVRRVLSDNQH
jgi:hypothetical protein